MYEGHQPVHQIIGRSSRLASPDGSETPPPVPEDFSPPTIRNTLPRKDIGEMLEEYPRSALTGIYLPDENIVYLDPRRVRHHNEQLGVLEQQDRLPDTFIPFLWSTYTMGDTTSAELDMPRSAGGAFQYVSRSDKDIEYISTADKTSLSDIYAAVYAVRRGGAPGESDATVGYLPDDARDLPAELLNELAVQRVVYELDDLYQELQFEGMLPEPYIHRRLDDDSGIVVEEA